MAGKNSVKEELARKAGSIKDGSGTVKENDVPVPAGETGGTKKMAGMEAAAETRETAQDRGNGAFVRLLRADEIECRVSVINEKGLGLLLFKDARVDQKILDETFTPFGWRRTHQSIDGNLYCTVEIWDKEKQQWVAKQDVGTVSYSEKEKGQASDSFKRACFNWGVGRELYTAPFIWVPAESVTIQKKGDRFTTSERFSVESISYNEQREITALVIVNGKGNRVFEKKMENRRKGKHGQDAGRKQSSRELAGNLITDMQETALRQELERTGVPIESVLARYQIQKLEEMTPEIYKKAINGLKKSKTKQAA